MKGFVFKIIGVAVLIFAIFGAFVLFKNTNSSPTGALVKDVSEIVNSTTSTVDTINEKTGIIDTIKDKTNQILGTVNTKQLIQKIIDLRKLSKENNLVEIANKVTDINKEIESIKNPSINTNWQVIVGCVYETCSDAKFLALIDAASINDLKGTNEVIHSIVETYNFWDGRNIIYFSQSLSNTNNLIEELNDKKISNSWDEVVKCNSKCDDFTDKIFNLIELINKQ